MNIKKIAACCLGFGALLTSCNPGSGGIDYGTQYKKEEFKTKVLEMYKKTEPFDTTNSTYKKLTGKIKWDIGCSDTQSIPTYKFMVAQYILGFPETQKDYDDLNKYVTTMADKNDQGIAIEEKGVNNFLNYKYFEGQTTKSCPAYYVNNDSSHFEDVENCWLNTLNGGGMVQGIELKHAIKDNRSSFYRKGDMSEIKIEGQEVKLSGTFEFSATYGFDDKSLEGYGYISRWHYDANGSTTIKGQTTTSKLYINIDFTVSK